MTVSPKLEFSQLEQTHAEFHGDKVDPKILACCDFQAFTI